MVAGLEVWQVLELIVEEKGDKEFGRLSNFGMENAIESYIVGKFSIDVHRFYNRNRLYFSFSRVGEDLKKRYEMFNIELIKNGQR